MNLTNTHIVGSTDFIPHYANMSVQYAAIFHGYKNDFRLNMTEKLFTGTLNHNKNKKQKK